MGSDAISGFMDKMEQLALSLHEIQMVQKSVLGQYKQLYGSYQHKKESYTSFQRGCDALFEGKSKEEWVAHIQAQIKSLHDQLIFFNKQIFFHVYSEHAIMQAPQKIVAVHKPKASVNSFEALFKELESS